jgi:hypothetical protein
MFASSRWGRAASIVALSVMIVGAAALGTRPTHIEHVERLFPGPVPLDLISYAELPEFVRHNHPPTSNTEYFDQLFFSTTRSTVTGETSTIGLLGMVFDVRSEFERETDQTAFNEARRRAILFPSPAHIPGSEPVSDQASRLR